MSKATTEPQLFGKIPNSIWNQQEWFIGKLQIPLSSNEQFPQALIYPEGKRWQLFVPMEWIKSVKIGRKPKLYLWMWFDKNHALNIEQGTKVSQEQDW